MSVRRKPNSPQLAVVVPGVLKDVVPSGFRAVGIIAIVELAEDAGAQVVGLPIEAGQLPAMKTCSVEAIPGVVSRADVDPQAADRSAQLEVPRRTQDCDTIDGSILQAVIRPVVFRGVGSGSIVGEPGVVPMRSDQVQHQAIAPELGQPPPRLRTSNTRAWRTAPKLRTVRLPSCRSSRKYSGPSANPPPVTMLPSLIRKPLYPAREAFQPFLVLQVAKETFGARDLLGPQLGLFGGARPLDLLHSGGWEAFLRAGPPKARRMHRK